MPAAASAPMMWVPVRGMALGESPGVGVVDSFGAGAGVGALVSLGSGVGASPGVELSLGVGEGSGVEVGVSLGVGSGVELSLGEGSGVGVSSALGVGEGSVVGSSLGLGEGAGVSGLSSPTANELQACVDVELIRSSSKDSSSSLISSLDMPGFSKSDRRSSHCFLYSSSEIAETLLSARENNMLLYPIGSSTAILKE